MFILQNTPPSTHRPSGLTMSQADVTIDAAKYDLTLSLVTGEHGLTGQLEYNTDLFDAAYVERFGGHFVQLLESGVAAPDAPVSELDLLTADEEQLLFVDWNDTDVDVWDEGTVPAAFARQVAVTPDAQAVVFGDDVLSYRELDERATQVANRLVELGVDRETLVGLSVARSIDMMVGLLGILKAGCAYVPLDPTYPQERLGHMIEDSGCPVIVHGGEDRRAAPRRVRHGALPRS